MKTNKFNLFQKVQLLFGIILFLVFLVTGQYLMHVIKPEYLNQIDQRMMARANHLYILFMSMINILESLIEFDKNKKWARFLGKISRVILMIAGVLFTCTFFNSYGHSINDRKIILFPTILVLIGVILAVSHVFNKNKTAA